MKKVRAYRENFSSVLGGLKTEECEMREKKKYNREVKELQSVFRAYVAIYSLFGCFCFSVRSLAGRLFVRHYGLIFNALGCGYMVLCC